MAMTRTERTIYERAQSVAQKYQDSHEKLEDLKKFLTLYKKIWAKHISEPEKNLINILSEYLK